MHYIDRITLIMLDTPQDRFMSFAITFQNPDSGTFFFNVTDPRFSAQQALTLSQPVLAACDDGQPGTVHTFRLANPIAASRLLLYVTATCELSAYAPQCMDPPLTGYGPGASASGFASWNTGLADISVYGWRALSPPTPPPAAPSPPPDLRPVAAPPRAPVFTSTSSSDETDSSGGVTTSAANGLAPFARAGTDPKPPGGAGGLAKLYPPPPPGSVNFGDTAAGTQAAVNFQSTATYQAQCLSRLPSFAAPSVFVNTSLSTPGIQASAINCTYASCASSASASCTYVGCVPNSAKRTESGWVLQSTFATSWEVRVHLSRCPPSRLRFGLRSH